MNSKTAMIGAAFIAICLGDAVIDASVEDDTRWIGATQDSTGLVWGIAETGEMLFTNSGGGWEKADSSVAGVNLRGTPEAITATPDGAVAILWNVDSLGNKSEKHFLTRHRGKDAAVIAEFSATLDEPSLFADSQNNFWMTGRGGEIYRLQAGRPVEKVYTIAASQCQIGPEREYVTQDYLDRIFPIEDGEGAIWFWTDARDWNVMSLAILLVYRDGRFDCPVAEGLPPIAECTYVVREDASHLLLLFRKRGLFRLDLHTLRGSPIIQCDEDQLKVISNIVRVSGQTYLSAWGKTAGRALWRLSEKVIPEKVVDLVSESKAPVPALALNNGILFGTAWNGLLWLPPNKSKIEQYDKLRGFRLSKVTQLFAMGNKGVLALGEEGSAMARLPPWSQAPTHGAFEIPDISEAPLKDQHGRFWARSRKNGESLKEWDGHTWKTHPLPPHKEVVNLPSVDSAGRIWLQSQETVFIFDPAKRHWRTEKGMHAALEHALAADRNFSLGENDAWHGAFAGDRRVCYREDTGVFLEYYDGKSWRVWKDKPVCYLRPSFDKAGQLTGVDNGPRWSFDGNEWKKEAEQPSPAPKDDTSKLTPLKINSTTTYNYDYDRVKHDEMGNAWLAENHRLYGFRRGLLAPVFAENEADPFCDGRRIRKAVNDGAGNVFFDSDAYGECLLLHFGKPPRTKVQGTLKVDSLAIKLSTDALPARWFEWRLDQSNWSKSTEQRDLAFSFLPNGKHVFEARGISARFQVDPKGAKYEFRVLVDREKQVAYALRSLHDGDFGEREKAVLILASQPGLAREQLQTLRQTASSDETWWIDAAIQEIDRASKSPSPRPSP